MTITDYEPNRLNEPATRFRIMKTQSSPAVSYANLRGNAPRRWQDYLMYPRVLFTIILCFLSLVLHVAFGIYVWLWGK